MDTEDVMTRRWSDLSHRSRRLIIGAAIGEAILKTVVLIDISHRPASQIRGSKRMWIIAKPLCVKWFGTSFLMLVSCAFAAVRRGRGVGWAQVREWLRRRAGIRGESRPRWRQCRSPLALPGP
jgi:hypothetical protein